MRINCLRKGSILTFLFIISFGMLARGENTLEESPLRNEEAYNLGFRNLLDSVVRIDVWEASYERGTKRTVASQGSGVIMTPEGHVLTNAHVASPYAEKIRVTLANLEHVDAKFIGWDHWTDLAVIQLKQEALKERKITFSHANFGNSKKLFLGQPVYAVGTPHGLTRTVTKGIISNDNRFIGITKNPRGHEVGSYNNWLQTDAAINPGNSGGALVTELGEVVGINSRTLSSADNLSFAIPGNVAQKVIEELIRHGKVVRSYIGIVPRPLQDLEESFDVEANIGLLIESVDPGSPAKKEGVIPGDIILNIDDTALDGRFPEQLPPILNKIASYPVGSSITLNIKRGKATLIKKVTTEKLESRIGSEDAFEDWGLSIRQLTRPIARERKLASADGFIVIGTQQAFPAKVSGLRSGDIITKLNGKTLENLEQFQNAYETYQKDPTQHILMEVIRNRNVHYIILKDN